MCRTTQGHPRAIAVFGHRPFTFFGVLFHTLNLTLIVPHWSPTTPRASPRFGLFRFRSPLLTESILFLFLRLLRCFTSPGIANSLLCIQSETTEYYPSQVTLTRKTILKICFGHSSADVSAEFGAECNTGFSAECDGKFWAKFGMSFVAC